MSIFLFIYQYKDFYYYFYSFYAIATCFHRSVCANIMLEHLTSLVTYIQRDVLRTISNDIILTHFQQIENILFSL